MAMKGGCCSIPSGKIYIGAWGGLLIVVERRKLMVQQAFGWADAEVDALFAEADAI